MRDLLTVQNIRLGFATNSSSSHSIVLTNSLFRPSESNGDYMFGWENFVLSEADEKMRYLAVAVYAHLCTVVSPESAALVTQQLFKDVVHLEEEALKSGYIDHQSMPSWSARGRSFEQQVAALMEALRDPRVYIFGGNDNTDDIFEYGHTLPADAKRFPTDVIMNARVDKDALIFFNRNSGAKVRFVSTGKSYMKSSSPELVDIKITDYCPYECKFCYQGSTKGGKKTPSIFAHELYTALAELNVFEVALGGGEPTAAPDFVYWIEAARAKGIVPNFTTYSVEWLRDANKVAAAAQCGGIGVSVHALKDVSKVSKIRNAIRDISWHTKVSAQHVFGLLSEDATLKLIEALWSDDIPVLLLGYKTVGFGEHVKPHTMSPKFAKRLRKLRDRLTVSEERKTCTLSCDTAFVDTHRDILSKLNVSETLISSPEGKFSCYIDAVEGKIGPSSYCAADQYASMEYSYHDLSEFIRRAFKNY
jgi:hypothetical protein